MSTCTTTVWGALLRTLLALTGPHTLVVIAYTERASPRLYQKFYAR